MPDPFFAIASQPKNADGTVNALYDPNFRGLDVEGYRIYRGRASNPSELTLIAQFDYPPDPFSGRGHFFDFRVRSTPPLGVRSRARRLHSVPGQRIPRRRRQASRSRSRRTSIWVRRRDRHPGHHRRPGTACNRNGADSPGKAGHRGHRYRSGQARNWSVDRPQGQRGSVRVHRPQRPEQPEVFLCGDGVRHEFGSVGTVEPRIGQGGQGRHSGSEPEQPRCLYAVGERDTRSRRHAVDQYHGADSRRHNWRVLRPLPTGQSGSHRWDSRVWLPTSSTGHRLRSASGSTASSWARPTTRRTSGSRSLARISTGTPPNRARRMLTSFLFR